MSDDAPDVNYTPGANTPEVSERRPYTVVLISDFQAGERLSRLSPVDKDDFAELLARAQPGRPIAINDPFGDGPDWEFKLTFDKLKTFEPAGLLAQVPGARTRLAVREKIAERGRGNVSADELANALNSAADMDGTLSWLRGAAAPATGGAETPPATPGGGSVLDLVDDPDESSRVKANVERLAAAAGDRAKQLSAAERARLNAVLDKLDSELSAITDLVLQHPDVRRLELAWRGLKFLVDRFDFREGVRLAVLDAPREEAVARFSAEVINPAFDGEIRTPGLVLFDYPITNTPADIALLDDLGQHAASLPVPAVFPLETAFFNVKDIKLIKNLPNLSGFVDGWQFAKWRSLRDKPYTRMLVPVLGRFLLRAPYAVTAESREFVASETVTAERELAWGGGHLALAVCAARSYARYGWPTRMFGAEAGKLEDLPVVPSSKDADKTWGPGDAFLPDRRLDEFAAIGINLLQSVKNNDYCILLGGVSLARPIARGEADKQQALLEISLPYQQFSNILSAYLCDVQPGLRGLAAEELQRRLIYGLRNLIGLTDKDAEDAVMVGTGPAPDDASQTLVQVRITPPGRIVPGGLCIDLGFTV